MMEEDPFKAYYEEAIGGGKKTETSEDGEIRSDASRIKGSINAFVRLINAKVGEIFKSEQAKGTRTDLIVTIVMGGLAFTLANVFSLIKKHLGSDMTREEYWESFEGMYDSALRDIEKKG